MTSTETSTHARARSTGRFWALLPVGLLGSSLLGLGTMASIATRDPSFALERDYYQRAVHFEEEQAQRVENARLGYQVSLEIVTAGSGAEVVVTLASKQGAPLPEATLRAEAFANARAADVRDLELRRDAGGRYRAKLERATPGLWEFRLVAVNEKERFTSTIRRDVPAGGAP
jgi:nitrogen fixation protein FixH